MNFLIRMLRLISWPQHMLERALKVVSRKPAVIPAEEPEGERLTFEYMRVWEKHLGTERVNLASSYLSMNGWPPLSQPPIWVWAMAFREAERIMPYEAEKSSIH